MNTCRIDVGVLVSSFLLLHQILNENQSSQRGLDQVRVHRKKSSFGSVRGGAGGGGEGVGQSMPVAWFLPAPAFHARCARAQCAMSSVPLMSFIHFLQEILMELLGMEPRTSCILSTCSTTGLLFPPPLEGVLR